MSTSLRLAGEYRPSTVRPSPAHDTRLQLRLVAVPPRIGHANDGADRNGHIADISAKRFPHQFFLRRKLSGIIHVLKLAAAANVVYGAFGRFSVAGCFFDLRESSGNVGRFHQHRLRFHDFPRQRPGNENRFALVISDTLSIDADPFDRDDHEIAGPDVFGRFGPLRPQFRAAGSFRCRCLPFEWFFLVRRAGFRHFSRSVLPHIA